MDDLFPLAVVAKKLGCHPSFLRKKCLEGELPAVLLGNEYRVRWADAAGILKRKPTKVITADSCSSPPELLTLIDAWLAYLSNIRACSPRTVDLYRTLMRSYFKRLASVGCAALTPEDMFDRRTVMEVFSKVPAKSYSTKMNTYLVLRSFGGYLVDDGKLASNFLEELKPLKPRRQVEPKRTSLKPEGVPRLLDTILTRNNPVADNATFAAMVACMVYAGLRVSEVCNLRVQDVDLESRVLSIIHGKGGRNRRVGVVNALYSYLAEYNHVRQPGMMYFTRKDGSAWTKDHVGKRMRVLSRKHGFDVTAHGLRRTFATLAANQGRSINSIRIALGHTNLETTQKYLRTSEAEVVEQMKDW